MKITQKQYAQALYDLTKGKNQEEIDAVVLEFSKELKKNRKMRMLGGIIEKFEQIYNAENEIVIADVVSATKLSEEQVANIIEFVKKKYKTKEAVLNQKIKKDIVGGIILKVGDDVIDGSVRGKIIELRKKLIQ
ncbi:MAG: ATP synthase F1 subunit delta [Candidatus Moranbacteria bacterium]|nr:ATP synthase F1 subunit delta [Candidatus Moranbacteria bacterium]